MRPLSLLLAALLLAGCEKATAPVEVNVAAINDFHGNLLSNPFSYQDAAAEGGVVKLKAGGIGALSGLVAQLRQQDPELLLIGAGDMIGGSPPISSMWADEPTLDALDLIGLKFTAVGNHELDQGKTELLRQIAGGCESTRPDKACQFDKAYKGTSFPYISANLMDRQTGKPVFQAYRIEQAHGAKIAFVGATLKDVAAYVSAKSMDGLYTVDEADAINALLPELKEQKVDAIVVVIHQGGETPERFDQPDCKQLGGDVVDVVKRLDPLIKVVVSAHTHQGYLCRVGDKLVTQGASFGRLMTHLTLTIDTRKHQLLDVKAENLVVDPQRYSATPEIAALQKEVETRSQAQLGQPLARLGARQVDRKTNASGESAMGDLIADAQLAATRADEPRWHAHGPHAGGRPGQGRLRPGRQRAAVQQHAEHHHPDRRAAARAAGAAVADRQHGLLSAAAFGVAELSLGRGATEGPARHRRQSDDRRATGAAGAGIPDHRELLPRRWRRQLQRTQTG